MVECSDADWSKLWLLSQSWLVVKSCASEKAEPVFFETKIKITTEGHRYLGGSVYRRKFKDLYITTKVNE